MTPKVLVVGLGNEYRSDDGAGPAVAAYVADRVRATVEAAVIGEPLDLLGKWDDARLCVVADATRSGAPAGTVQIVELGESGDADSCVGAMSTHGMDLARVLRLARAVGSRPQRVVVVGIEGGSFSDGRGLSAPVAAGVAEAGEIVIQLVAGAVPCA